jgi:hypothetical protein
MLPSGLCSAIGWIASGRIVICPALVQTAPRIVSGGAQTEPADRHRQGMRKWTGLGLLSLFLPLLSGRIFDAATYTNIGEEEYG